MKTLQIDESTARKNYKSATSEFQAMLRDTFGEAFFSEKITDKVKTFEDACEVLGINANEFEMKGAFAFMPDDFLSIVAYSKLIIIVRALNEGWQPNWDNSNESKYYPWFNMSGSAFSYFDCDYVYSGSYAGSRLVFKSKKLAEYAAKQFVSIYKEYFLISK